ncbi:MAG: nucleotidyltransferase family protein [Silvibacterium sp.]
MESIILAGGLGTRLGSRLNGIPKPMAQVANRPFLEILMDRLIDGAFNRTLLSVGHLSTVIAEHFGNCYRGMPLEYVVEETPLGTGGAIRQALWRAREDAVFVLNGDTHFEVDYSEMLRFHTASEADLTIGAARVPDVARYGGLELIGDRVSGFIEKGCTGAGWINAGVYVLTREFPWPENLPSKFSFETDVLVPLLPRLKHSVFIGHGHFLDIGVPEDLDRAQVELGSRRPDPNPAG